MFVIDFSTLILLSALFLKELIDLLEVEMN